jgi:hypothetical protein
MELEIIKEGKYSIWVFWGSVAVFSLVYAIWKEQFMTFSVHLLETSYLSIFIGMLTIIGAFVVGKDVILHGDPSAMEDNWGFRLFFTIILLSLIFILLYWFIPFVAAISLYLALADNMLVTRAMGAVIIICANGVLPVTGVLFFIELTRQTWTRH